MLDWEVLDEREGEIPPEKEPPSTTGRRRAGWRSLLLLVLLLTVVVGTLFWLQLQRRDEQLHADLRLVIEAEERLMGIGLTERGMRESRMAAWELTDPAAPANWQSQYHDYLYFNSPLPTLPEIASVRLEQDGRRAIVEVIWPTAGTEAGNSEPLRQRRAYRLANGRWYRTPLFVEEVEQEERELKGFLLHGPPEALDALLTPGSDSYLDLEGLVSHLERVWPPRLVQTKQIYLTLTTDEFPAGPGPFLWTNQQTLVLPSFEIYRNLVHQHQGYLPPAALYRLSLANHVVMRSMLDLRQQSTWSHDTTLLLTELRQAEVRYWTLSASERKALRNQWRQELGEEWSFPLDHVPAPSSVDRTERWSRQLALLIEYLISVHGPEVPARLAHNIEEIGPEGDLKAYFAPLMGRARSYTGIAEKARAFALHPEP